MPKKSRQKLKYLENEKSFQDEIESIFHHFWRAIIEANNFFLEGERLTLSSLNHMTLSCTKSKLKTPEQCRPGREWLAITRAHARTRHILFSCAIIARLNFVFIIFRRVMTAHLGLLNDKIARIKYSFQIKNIPLWNIPFRYFWTYQLPYEIDNWLLNP